MGKADRQSPRTINKVRLEIRKVIAANDAWRNAVDDIIKAARPTNKAATKRARKGAISTVIGNNAALRAAAEKIFRDVTGG
jgi:hypothetical protein